MAKPHLITVQPKKARSYRPTILVAEDSVDTRLILTRTLEFEEYSYLQATNGEAALALAIKHRPDLILLDLMLPQLNGFQVLMRLKALNIDTKICVVSAMDGEDFVKRALDFGASDYIIKPVLPETISQKVKELLGETTSAFGYFQVPCFLTATVCSEDAAVDARVTKISENHLGLQCAANFRAGDIVTITSPTLSCILERDRPIFAKIAQCADKGRKGTRLRKYLVEVIGMPEAQRQRFRATAIKGKFVTDEAWRH